MKMMSLSRSTAVGLGLGIVLLAWNVMRLTSGTPFQGATSHLLYLPEPEVARLMSFGHQNTSAKLQWIDSFKYFQYQLDERDDSVAGDTRGAFDRLYSNLIGLDPLFIPYYEYGVTAAGGLIEDHVAELRMVMHGTYNRPDASRLWALRASCLQVFFDYEERFPEQMEGMLEDWAAAERAHGSGREIWPLKWIANMGRRYDRGLMQAGYWGRQLASTKPDSQRGELAQELMREQLALHGVRRLTGLTEYWEELHGSLPSSLDQLLEIELVEHVYRQREWSAPYGLGEPLQKTEVGYVLRNDPFGFDYVLANGSVESFGLQVSKLERQLGRLNGLIREQARKQGRWPQGLDEIPEFIGVSLPEVPDGYVYDYADQRVVLKPADGIPRKQWDVEQLLKAVGIIAEKSSDSVAEGGAESAQATE